MLIETLSECPVPGGAFDCPYCDPNGICLLARPWEKCDDYMAYTGCGEDEEEG